MTINLADGKYALEMQGLERLKTTARTSPEKGIKAASQQFESLFLQQVLKSMRATVPKSGLVDTSTTEFYTDMLDAQLAQNMSGRGLGFAEMIENSLRAKGGLPPDETDMIAGIPRSAPRSLEPYSVPSQPAAVSPFARPAWEPGVQPDTGGRAPHVTAFLNQHLGAARSASEKYGVPLELMLAQAALETGWGTQQIKTAQGGSSHNLFGIKAGSQWQGATTQITTTEYNEGVASKQQAVFRVYPNSEAAFHDYARLISQSERYQGVMSAPDARSAAYAVQHAGYATDPAYANKLVSVIDNLGPLKPEQTLAKADDVPFGSNIW